MSESSKVWGVTVKDTEHAIEISHGTFTGNIVLTLGGTRGAENRMLLRRAPVDFDVSGHRARAAAEFAYGGFSARSTLHIDGRYVEPLV